jgi:hypothetical protein
MKSKIRLTIFTLVIGLLLISCKKDKDDTKPTDNRDKYIGQYQVHEKFDCTGFPECAPSEKDSIISVTYGSTDTTLYVLGKLIDKNGHPNVFYYSRGC